MRSPRIRVVLGRPEDTSADIILRAGAQAAEDGRVVTVSAPRWQPPRGTEHLLAEAYRDAVAAANARQARTMALPAILARGPWPLEDVTRIALTVLKSTPTTVHEVLIAAGTPAMVERWAEALIREPNLAEGPAPPRAAHDRVGSEWIAFVEIRRDRRVEPADPTRSSAGHRARGRRRFRSGRGPLAGAPRGRPPRRGLPTTSRERSSRRPLTRSRSESRPGRSTPPRTPAPGPTGSAGCGTP